MRSIGTVAAASLLALGAIGIGAGQAQATTDGWYTTNGVALRGCPKVSCELWGRGNVGDIARIYCYRMGQSINGDAGWSINDRYFSDGSSTWQSGYSSDYYLGWPGYIYPC